jgi:phosphoglycolate phosphatase
MGASAVRADALRCVLFDLDGTLVDTAPDMAAALNALRAEEGLAPMPQRAIRNHVSHGSAAMVRLGFGAAVDPAEHERLRLRFLDLYSGCATDASRLFPDMDRILDAIEASGRRWGIVTNKPGWLTDPLVAALGLAERADCVVSGDTCARRKPHPDPLLHAAQITGTHPRDCVYVGDASRDIEAGRGAGMTTLVALFGYIDESQAPESWGAQGYIEQPLDLLAWLDAEAAPEGTPAP